MSDADDLIRDYLVDLCPEEMLHALHGLAAVKYPVNDSSELERRLRKDKRKPGLLSLLQPVDFPLAGPRNAFDKLAARTQQQGFPGISVREPSLPDPDEDDNRFEPAPPECEYFRSRFAPFCAAQACAEYTNQRIAGEGEHAAKRKGERKGEECEALLSALRKWWARPTSPGIPPRLP